MEQAGRERNVGYAAESFSDFIAQLEEAMNLAPDYRRAYRKLNEVFRRCLTLHTSGSWINFGGDYAKTDYLLKMHDATGRLRKEVNAMRARLRHLHEAGDEDLRRTFIADLTSLCQLLALIYKADVPAPLAALMPRDAEPEEESQAVRDCLRVTVERWDDTYVYVRSEAEEDKGLLTVCYARPGTKDGMQNWAYLKELFHIYVPLNLIRPRELGGVLYPELIIYQPDYLVSISTVAHCFTNYADSPVVDLLRRLQPQPKTEAILLGNMAGQLLDECIHDMPDGHTYADSAKEFFKQNALGMLTTSISPQFHQEAQRQQENIEHAIKEALPRMVPNYDPAGGMVEPSFFSEMLGLQGRMDYLQMDYSLLMEQKSGRGAWPQGEYVKPKQTDEHYVQMLLYRAVITYNFRPQHERNGCNLHTFMLYSRYTDSLLGLGNAPELLYKAFRVRNRLAWAELKLAQPDGYRLLERLTLRGVNKKHDTSRLWTDYQAPQIAQLLGAIKLASPVERAYYFRMLSFIAKEHVLGKMGNNARACSGFASMWHDSLADKREAGNIYDGLTLAYPDKETAGRIEAVELRYAETADYDIANFREGDIVILYPYNWGEEPDARKTMVLRCVVERIGTATIRLRLRNAQTDKRVFSRHAERPWAIEHDFMESSFAPLYRGMQAFLTAPRGRRNLLMMLTRPRTWKEVRVRGEYGWLQNMVHAMKRARDLFLIIGPPGTGKTSFGMMATLMEELREPVGDILLLSYTNRAVDEISSKLADHGIDFVRLGSESSCAERYRPYLLSAKVEELKTLRALREKVMKTRVMVSNITTMTANLELLNIKHFSLAIIDEASQILEPHLVPLLCARGKKQPSIRKFVLIGDHKQLPAVVRQSAEESMVREPLLRNIGLRDCRESLFERFVRQYRHDPRVCYMLKHQGRMHHEIAIFPNTEFYKSRLLEVPLPHQTAALPTGGEGFGQHGITDLLMGRRIAFFDVERPEEPVSDKVNPAEAEMIAATVRKIYELEHERGFRAERTVGVIVPYRNQIATIRQAIDAYGVEELHNISIDTVERFQGSQRKYILYGFTVQQKYQLQFLCSNQFVDESDGTVVDRKLNVAMTRAEEHLYMYGNAALLANNATFDRLIKLMKARGTFFRVKKQDYIGGRFSPTVDGAEEA